MERLKVFLFAVSACVVFDGDAQNFTSSLNERLAKFYTSNIPVKLHLYFNQPEYAPGDTAYFTVSFVTANSFHGIEGRMIVNVDLIDERGDVVLHQKVSAENGFGYNQIAFPSSLRPGEYTIAAYNEWMRNFNSSFFFYSKIVVGGIRKQTNSGESIRLFPEGGNVIAGVVNKVVVRGAPGATIKLRDNSGHEKATCRIDSVGLGVMFMTPQENVEYVALDDAGHTAVLSRSTTNKIGLLVTPSDGSKPMRIVLQAGERSSLIRDSIDLVIIAQDVIEYSARVKFNSKNASLINVPQDKMSSGIVRIVVFRNEQDVIAERLVYIPPSVPTASITLAKDEFQPREKVTVRLTISNGSGMPVGAKVSVSVFSRDIFKQSDAQNSLAQTLYLWGDLPFGHLEMSKAMTHTQTDNYLITKTWDRFSWQDIFSGSKKATVPFASELFLTGQVKRLSGNDPFPDSTMIALFLPKNKQTYFEYLTADGRFDLPLFYDFMNTEDVFYRVINRNRIIDNVRVEIASKDHYSDLHSGGDHRAEATTRYAEFGRNRKEIAEAFHPVSTLKTNSIPGNVVDSHLFTPDFSVNLRDYKIFPTMEEMLREVVPALDPRVKDGKTTVRMVRSDLGKVPDYPPIYFIDGVLTDETDYFLSLNPEDVSTIKVINTSEKLSVLGAVGMNGVVLVETLIAGNADHVPASRASFKAVGLNEQKEAHTISNRAAGQVRVPQLNANLYWQPQVVTSDRREIEFSFYTADNTGDFVIQVNGMTSESEPVYAEKTFRVKFDPPR